MKQKTTSFLFKRFIILFFPLVIVIGSIYVSYLMFANKTALDGMKNSEYLSMGYFADLIVKDFAQVESDLLALAKLPDFVHHDAERTTSHSQLTANYIKELALVKKKYDQIRYIDVSGQEQVRIDFNNGQPSIVNQSKLQDKSSRYYVEETIKLKEGEIFVSSLDLNIENGAIETPYKPVIRFATPVYDEQKRLKGLVVVNYLAENLRSTFLSHQAGMSLGESYLVDERGNILFSKDYSLGLALNSINKTNSSLNNEKVSTLKREIMESLSTSSELVSDEGHYLAMSLFNREPSGDNSTASIEQNISALHERFDWTIVVFISNSELRQFSLLFSTSGIFQAVFLLLMTAVVALILAKFGQARQIEQIERTQEAQDRQHELESLIQAIPSGIIICDENGIILEVNSEIELLFGYQKEELVGDVVDQLVPLSSRKGHVKKRLDFTQSERIAEYNKGSGRYLSGLSKSGIEVPVSISLRKINTRSGLKIVVSVIDITESVAKQDELEMLSQKAESANKAKSLFLSTMSHEIRTPLNAIIGMLYLHESSPLNSEQQVQVSNLKLASDKLLMLINDVLDFSKIEAGEMRLERSPFALSPLLEGLSNIFKYQAEKRSNHLKISSLAASQFPVLVGDSSRLSQILSNLLSNACKFTENGTVSLDVEQIGSATADRIVLRFEVGDSGIGISEEAQETLFSAFSQADASINRKFGGTGLGLSIVKRLTEMMGGKVSVSSGIGQGSKFSLEIPFEYSSQTLAKATHSEINRPLRVLIADDEEVNRAVLSRQAEHLGWTADTVSSGNQLIEKVLEHKKDENPIDCIIVDWQMPEFDGLKTISELGKKLEAKHMPSVIMVTAHDRSELLKAMGSIKADSVLTKPVQASYLFNSVNEAVVKHGAAPEDVLKRTTFSDTDVLWLDGMRILVVDDSEMNLYICESILQKHGALVTKSLSGASAIEILQESVEAFDVVLMDIQMPDMDGLEATQIIRKKLNLRIPIIALSAGVSIEEKQSVADAGMDAFLAKPMDPEFVLKTLIQQVSEYRQKVRNEAELSQQSKYEQSNTHWPEFQSLDKELVLKNFGNDLAFYTKMLDLYVRKESDVVEEINSLITDRNFDEAKSKLHKLKGDIANLGFLSVADAAVALESALLDTPNDLSKYLSAFKMLHTKLIEDIKTWLSTMV